jgi:type IV pilus assembly protein PilA
MKTEFKAKFLQHINKRRQDEGFTLIELLVVIIIIGILSAIALPSFLNQANKAKQSEAKQYIASLNKGQQAYYTEYGKFTSDISVLGVGIKTDTTNYAYACTGNDAAAACAGETKNTASLNSYAGLVFLDGVGDAKTSRTLLCETTSAGASGVSAAGGTSCPSNMRPLS